MRAATGRLWRFATWLGLVDEVVSYCRGQSRAWLASLGRAPLAMVLVVMASGIVLDHHALWPQRSFALIPLLVTFWLVIQRIGWDHSAAVLLLMTVALGAASWHHAWMHIFPEEDLARLATHHRVPMIVEARLLDVPRIQDEVNGPLSAMPGSPISRCRVQVDRLRDGLEWRPVSGRGQLVVKGRLTHVHVGDEVRIHGYLERPMAARNPGELSRQALAEFRRELFRLRASQPEGVQLLRKVSSWDPAYWLPRFRSATEVRLRSQLPPSVGNLSVALLLGAQECVERESVDAFLATGTLHLLSISGLHVMILASSLLAFMSLLGLSNRHRVTLLISVIVVYAIFTGGRAPVVRAAMAITLWGVEWLLHRNRTGWNALCAAAILVLLINPTHLFQIGAQLSFLAMFGIVVIYPKVRRRKVELDPLDHLIQRSRPRFWRWSLSVWRNTVQMFGLSTLLWLISLPLVAASFHVISLVAVVMNLVMWLPVWVAMVSGFIVLLLIWIAPPLAGLVAWLHVLSLDGLIWAGEWGEQIVASHFWVSGPGAISLAVFYSILVVGSLMVTSRRVWWGFLLVSWVGLLVCWPLGLPARNPGADPHRMSVWFLSIGHGTCVVIESPTDVMMYDAGCLGHERFAADTISRFLWSRRIPRIDTLVISHADVDHFSAVPRLVQRFPVGRICLSSATWKKESPSLDVLRMAAARVRIPIQWVQQGDILWSHAAGSVEVLHPVTGAIYANDNAGSIVLAVQFGTDRLLLPGDLEQDGMAALIRRPPWPVDVALAPHHGSLHAAPAEFVRWCQPKGVVVSGGDSAEAPVRSTYRLLDVPVWHTAAEGAVVVELDQVEGVRVHSWHEGRNLTEPKLRPIGLGDEM